MGPTLVASGSLNNQPVLRFVRSTTTATIDDLRFTAVPHATTNDLSFLAVVQPNASFTIGNQLGFFLGSTVNTNDTTKIGAWNSPTFFNRISSGGNQGTAAWPTDPGTPEPRIVYVQRNAADTITSGFDGATPGSALTQSATSRINRIGGPTDSATNNQDWPGDIAELAFFARPLNSVEQTLAANYLASKYDIPLNTAGGALDKYAGDTSLAGDYDLDVFGIGADATNSVITAGNAGFGIEATGGTLDSGEFILAGHRTASNSIVTTDLPTGLDYRWGRVWYVDTNGGSVNANLAFGFADGGLASPVDGVTYTLLRSASSSPFSFIAAATAESSGGKVVFPLNGLTDGYYTLGGMQHVPNAVDDAATTDEATPAHYDANSGVLANDSDADAHDTLSVIAVNGNLDAVGVPTSLPSGALVTIQADGSYVYDPNGAFEYLGAGQSADDAFTYTVMDSPGGGIGSVATVTVTVTGLNDVPVANDDFADATENGSAVSINLTQNDTDADDDTDLTILSFSGVSDLGATVTRIDGDGVSYDPSSTTNFDSLAAAETVVDTFPYTVTDAVGLVYDGFEEYPVGPLESSSGAGRNGGIGWHGAWNVVDAYRSNITVVSGGLNYANGEIVVDGGDRSLQIQAQGTEWSETPVVGSRSIPTQTGDAYMSLLVRTSTADGNADDDFSQWGLHSSINTPAVSVTHRRVGSGHDFRARSSSTEANAGTPTELNRTYFLVIKASKNGSTNYNRVQLWVDPDSVSSPGFPTQPRTRTAASAACRSSWPAWPFSKPGTPTGSMKFGSVRHGKRSPRSVAIRLRSM
jgi:VCBS repeat-containing protein